MHLAHAFGFGLGFPCIFWCGFWFLQCYPSMFGITAVVFWVSSMFDFLSSGVNSPCALFFVKLFALLKKKVFCILGIAAVLLSIAMCFKYILMVF